MIYNCQILRHPFDLCAYMAWGTSSLYIKEPWTSPRWVSFESTIFMPCDKVDKSTQSVHPSEEFRETKEAITRRLLDDLQCVWDIIQMCLVTHESSLNCQPDSTGLLHFLVRTFFSGFTLTGVLTLSFFSIPIHSISYFSSFLWRNMSLCWISNTSKIIKAYKVRKNQTQKRWVSM